MKRLRFTQKDKELFTNAIWCDKNHYKGRILLIDISPDINWYVEDSMGNATASGKTASVITAKEKIKEELIKLGAVFELESRK